MGVNPFARNVNTVSGNYYSAIGGGNGNIVSGNTSVISGGDNNTVSGNESLIGGGLLNTFKP